VRVLALAIGAREAARKLKLNENTVCGWASTGHWNLPSRKNGRPKGSKQALKVLPSQAYENSIKERETRTRDQLAIAAERGAYEAAQLGSVLPEAVKLQALVGAIAKTFGWASGGQPSVNYYGDVNTVVVCDEAKRKQLIEQRARLLEQEAIDV